MKKQKFSLSVAQIYYNLGAKFHVKKQTTQIWNRDNTNHDIIWLSYDKLYISGNFTTTAQRGLQPSQN